MPYIVVNRFPTLVSAFLPIRWKLLNQQTFSRPKLLLRTMKLESSLLQQQFLKMLLSK
jgi:hypothetical protein